MKKYFIIAFLLLIAYPVYAQPLNDEFSGSVISGSWTQFTNDGGSLAQSGGELQITVTATSFSGVKQTGITGTFDVMARLGDANYPSEILTVEFVALYVYTSGTSENYVFGYQNLETPTGNSTNEIKVGNDILGTPWGINVDWPISEYICVRISRDESDKFHVYYNANSDCSGSWTEGVTNPTYQLEYSGAVDIVLQARSDGETELTYTVDRFVCTSGGCDSVDTIIPTIEGATRTGCKYND